MLLNELKDKSKIKEAIKQIKNIKVVSALKDIALKGSQLKIENFEFWTAIVDKIYDSLQIIEGLPRKNMMILMYVLGRVPKKVTADCSAKIGRIIENFLTAIVEKFSDSKLEGRELSLILFCLQKNEYYNAKFLEMALKYLSSNLSDLNHIDFVTSIYSISKIYEALTQKPKIFFENHPEVLTPNKLQSIVGNIFEANTNINEKIVSTFNQRDFLEKNFVNLVWGLNKLNQLDNKLWQLAQKTVTPMLRRLEEENFKILGTTLVHSQPGNF
jgi:cobalamin biosynthesis Mg chelatase CobN